jgi:hypothetical protein
LNEKIFHFLQRFITFSGNICTNSKTEQLTETVNERNNIYLNNFSRLFGEEEEYFYSCFGGSAPNIITNEKYNLELIQKFFMFNCDVISKVCSIIVNMGSSFPLYHHLLNAGIISKLFEILLFPSSKSCYLYFLLPSSIRFSCVNVFSNILLSSQDDIPELVDDGLYF